MQFGSYLYLGYLSPWAVPIFTVHKVVKTGPSLGPSSLAPPPRCYQFLYLRAHTPVVVLVKEEGVQARVKQSRASSAVLPMMRQAPVSRL